MMTDRAAMKLALEALERSMEAGMTGIKVDQAIAALRKALEQTSDIEAAIKKENEACAKASERQIERWVDDRARYAASECAAAIRERMK